jgi:hypothetical protein
LVVLDDKRCYCALCERLFATVQAGVNHCRTHRTEPDCPLHYLGRYCWATGVEGGTWCCACARRLAVGEGWEQHTRNAQHTTNVARGWREAADEKINSKKTKVLFRFSFSFFGGTSSRFVRLVGQRHPSPKSYGALRGQVLVWNLRHLKPTLVL